jgi:uncharacterized protein YbaP (TraB family)
MGIGLTHTIVSRIAALKALAPSLAGVLLLSASTAPSLAQGTARNGDLEGEINQELVVRARVPGPAWWRVSDGDSFVWIIGVPGSLPKTLKWDDRPVKARLESATALIIPPDNQPSPLKSLMFYLTHRKAFKSRAALEDSLPPQLARRFAAAREKLGKPASAYASWRPAIAGLMLDGEVGRRAGLKYGEPLGQIRSLGRKAGVREQPVGRDPLQLDVLLTMSDEQHQKCLSDALDVAEEGPERLAAADQGWAVGDLHAAIDVSRGFDGCFAALPSVSALLERGEADTAAAIREALKRPGHAVAIVDLHALLAKGGVIDRLRAQGLRVQTPDKLE